MENRSNNCKNQNQNKSTNQTNDQANHRAANRTTNSASNSLGRHLFNSSILCYFFGYIIISNSFSIRNFIHNINNLASKWC